MKNYAFAVNYARLFVGEWSRDLVHSTYLNYYIKTGDNIFDRDVPYLKTYIKYASLNLLRSGNKAFRNGFRLIGYEDWMTEVPFDDKIDAENKLELLKQLIRTKHPRAHDKILLILDYKLQGYNLVDLPNLVELSYNTVRDYWLTILQYCKELKMNEPVKITNPFNGSNVVISKRVSRKTYESNPEKYKDFVYDSEKDCDHNEFYELIVNSEGTYILIKEKNDQ